MAITRPPKVLLFDIGGVCVSPTSAPSTAYPLTVRPRAPLQVVSPMQAILDYETAHAIPPGWVNFSISRTSPDGAWHQLERGEIKMDGGFFEAFNRDLRRGELWAEFYSKLAQKGREGGAEGRRGLPQVPNIDGEWLFWDMMRVARTPDPWMYPALRKLKASGRFLLGALSNTVIFPEGHEYNESGEDDVRGCFDVFISSAHVGLRKPDSRIYELAVRELDRFARDRAGEMDKRLRWREGVRAEEVVFLEDIGSNLKAAKDLGMKTVRVGLGKGLNAVRELERITGLELVEETATAKL